jgi:hypothetical protein
MTPANPNTRIRATAATRHRDARLRMILGALRDGPMRRDALRDLLGVSRSGINRYLAILRAAEVIEVERDLWPTCTSPGHLVFRLIANGERVDDYLRVIALPPPPPPQPSCIVPPDDPACRIHRLPDDSRWPLLSSKGRFPAPDPVLAAFYGMA